MNLPYVNVICRRTPKGFIMSGNTRVFDFFRPILFYFFLILS